MPRRALVRASLAALIALAAAAPPTGAAPLAKLFPKGPANSGASSYVALASDGAVWTQGSGGLLSRINPSTGVATAGFPLSPGGSHAIGVVTSGTTAWVADSLLKTVTRYGPGGGVAVAPQPLGFSPSYPALGPDGGLWLAAGAADAARVDLGGAVVGGFPSYTTIPAEPGFGTGVSDVAAAANGGAWMVGRSSNSGSPHGWLLHMTSGGVVDVFKNVTDHQPDLVAVQPGGDVWAVSFKGWVWRFAPDGLLRAGYPKSSIAGTGSDAAVAPNGDLWVSGNLGLPEVERFSAASDTRDQDVVLTAAAPAQARGIAVDANGDPWVGLDTATGGASSLAHIFVGGTDLSGSWTDPATGGTGGAGGGTPGGGGATPGGGGAPAPAAVTATPPKATVGVLKALRIARLLKARALTVPVVFTGAGSARVTATVPAAAARALGLKPKRGARSAVLATRTVRAPVAGTVTAKLTFPAVALRALKARPRAFKVTVAAQLGAVTSRGTLSLKP